MTNDQEHAAEPDSSTARQLDHNQRNQRQSELIQQELERMRRAGHRATAIRRGLRHVKTHEETGDQ